MELKKITLMVLEQNKVKADSNLAKSVEYVYTADGVQMMVASYYPYVSGGRKAGIRRVPVADLIQWIKKKNIRPRRGQTINQLAYAISESIYKRGIKAKSFEEKVANGIADYATIALADELAEQIADDLEYMVEI
jgi:hypothetical protein